MMPAHRLTLLDRPAALAFMKLGRIFDDMVLQEASIQR